MVKIKSTIFTKVLSEEYIEVNKSVPATISALREISGSSRDAFPLRKSRGYMMLPYMEEDLKNHVKIIERWD